MAGPPPVVMVVVVDGAVVVVLAVAASRSDATLKVVVVADPDSGWAASPSLSAEIPGAEPDAATLSAGPAFVGVAGSAWALHPTRNNDNVTANAAPGSLMGRTVRRSLRFTTWWAAPALALLWAAPMVPAMARRKKRKKILIDNPATAEVRRAARATHWQQFTAQMRDRALPRSTSVPGRRRQDLPWTDDR